MNTRPTQSAITAAALLALAAACQGQTAPTNGWTQTFADEFEGSSIDLNKWVVTNEPGQFNNERQYYTPQNVTSASGRLTLKSEQRTIGGRAYASGKVTTLGKFGQQFGRFEMKAKLPKTQGIWPAFWMLPTAGQWPPEIDIMELLGHQPTTVYATNHWGVFPSAYSYNTSPFPGSIDYSTNYNTFAVEWDQGRLDFYVNGAKRATHTGGVPAEPFYMVLNTAVGGNWPGYPDATTVFPQTFDVEYVRAYRRTLFNADFENLGPTNATPLDRWNSAGNRFIDTGIKRSGARSAKLFGPFVSGGGTSSLWQDVPVRPGQRWRASAWWHTPSSDQMRGQNTTFTRIEWRNAAGALISFESAPALSAASPANLWTRSIVEGVAPEGAVTGRLLLLFVQPGMEAGAAFVDDADFQMLHSNSGMEIASATAPTLPADYVATGPVSLTTTSPRSGLSAARLTGTNSGSTNLTTLTQDLPARPGQVLRLGAWWRNAASEPITGSNSALNRIEFFDSQRRTLGIFSVPSLTAASPLDTYQQTIVQAAAPAGSVWARLHLQYAQIGSATGAATIDDISFRTLLSNAGFEDSGPGDDTPMYDWVPFGAAFTTTTSPRTSRTALRLPAPTAGQPAGVYQDFTIAPRQRWRASAWMAQSPAEPLTGSATGVLRFEWLSAAGQIISSTAITGLSAADPAGTYRQAVVESVPPPNAARGRLVLTSASDASPGAGALLVDDINLELINPCGTIIAEDSPVCVADYDCSGTIAVDDIFSFLSAWFAGNPRADINLDGLRGVDDIFSFLTSWFARC